MRTKDHRTLGRYLSETVEMTYFGRAAFVWGSIEPDINCLTHFRGFTVKGHQRESCEIRIGRLHDKIKKRRMNILNCYAAGKLMHYMADIFTFTHNDMFTGSLKEHVEYEHMLSRRFADIFASGEINDGDSVSENDITEMISRLHRQYCVSRRNEMDDIRYIIEAATKALDMIITCRPR